MGYTASGRRIKLTRGDTAFFKVSINYFDTQKPYEPEEGDLIRFTLKRHLSDRTASVVKDVSVDTMLLRIDPDDTASLPLGRYYYDIQLIRSNGETDTFISDILELTKEVG